MTVTVEIKIGGRTFEVACQPGEEAFLRSASEMLDVEAQDLMAQIGRMPESRMLLMAGLMLADRTAAVEDKIAEAQATMARMEQELEAAKSAALAASEQSQSGPSAEFLEGLSALTSEVEAVAARLEDRLPEA